MTKAQTQVPTDAPPDTTEVLSNLKKITKLRQHIDNVIAGAWRISQICIENGKEEFGRNIIANAYIHDQSKFRGFEWDMLACPETDNKDLRFLAIKSHREINKHHPEHWGGVDMMPEIYLAEMVCDTYARSVEMGTNLREWWKDVGIEKYGLSKNGKSWKLIKKYIDMILDEEFK